MRKGQGWRPLLFGALDDTASLIGHDSVINITKWAQEYFQKPLSVTQSAVHLQMTTKSLSLQKETIWEHGPEAPSCLWAKDNLTWTVSSGKVFYDHMSPNEGRTFQRGHSIQFKANISNGMGCIPSEYGKLACFGRRYECWKVIKVLEQHMLPSRWRVIHQDKCKTTILQLLQQHDFGSRRVRVLNWPAYRPDLSPIENILVHH